MLNEGEISIAFRRAPVLIPPELVAVAPDLVPPAFQGKRRIGEDTVESPKGLHAIASQMLGVEQSVTTGDQRIVDVVQEQVHLGDGPGVQVPLLPEQRKAFRIFTLTLQVVNSLQEHATGSAGGIVD